ncbi:hypothetical protein AGABI2DRAFT_121547, partial [Agaricus bisporus var. bisporus H97]|uniref:hypothetical protein n=1 Tax=Agaricus bisporus var. bisporus (strain H97 / ATCC MYA-4626 / FGSC 10389) TaxID=936046 RepID=UPI00029F6ED5
MASQRRVSLALPASAPRVPWAFRDDTGLAGPSSAPPPAPPEKKPRKKWSPEETQMLVDGCNRHGVGNWKTILSDPTLTFDNRSPVDLKDRFRTYFPDAYKKHYPNARTHLSSKVRSTLPDGSSLFEKTRSKRRRPFTEEEDRALKAGYEKHGTVWATIVKDPIFQEQNRRSTDLRDRFRNAFPELYQAAGYKPRNNTSKKKKELSLAEDVGRAATDDQLALSSSGATGPVRGIRRRRAQTSQGILLRGGTKSVPQSAACSEYEDSSGPEDEDGYMSTTNMPKTPLSLMALVPDSMKKNNDLGLHLSPSSTIEHSFIDDDDMGMRLIPLDSISSDPLAEYPSSPLENHPQPPNPISTLQHTPTHSHHTWPPSSQDSSHDGTKLDGNGSHPTSQQHYDGPKIGQSAWGPQDWLSANPRLDHSFPSNSSGNGTPGTGTPSSYFSPSSPFTSYNLPPLNNANPHPLSPPPSATSTTTATSSATTSPPAAANSTTATSGNAAAPPPPSSSSPTSASTTQTTNPLIGNITNLTTLNLPMNYINNYNSHQHHGVIERYDLWPPSSSALALSSTFSAMNNSSGWSGPFGSESFAGDISSNSEVSFNEDEAQSAFSDDYTGNADEVVYNSMGYLNNNPSGRAITHHSDYAGDLIFGARGYGLGGGFGWFGSAYAPPNTTGPHSASGHLSTPGLGLMGMTGKGDEKTGEGDGRHRNNGADSEEVVVVGDGKGSINPMQLHAPSSHTQTTTAGVDEIALAGINLNDSQDTDEEMQAVNVDGARGGENGEGGGGGRGIEVVSGPVEEDDAMDGMS